MSARPHVLFHEVQRLPQPRMLVLLAPPIGLTLLLIWQVILGHPWGSRPMANASVVMWTVFVWLLFARFATIRLVTDLFPGEIVIAMRGLFRKRRVSLSEIADAASIEINPVKDYGGYGIRTLLGGKAYIAGGHTAVRLNLTDGSVVVLSSANPGALAALIRQR